MIRLLAFALALLPCMAAGAEDHLGGPDLPPIATVEKAIDAQPSVRAARDGIRAEIAGRRRLEVGPYEFALRGGYQSHNLSSGRFPEYEIGIERPLRLPQKAQADADVGRQNVELARRIAYSAWCDGARHLLRLWFGWARENVQRELWQQQAEALREQVAVVAKRARAGDAPRVEVNLAEAAAAQAEAVLENARGREQGARDALARTFPPIPIPARAIATDPGRLERDLDWFVDRVRVHNDEIRVARAAAKRGLLVARRASAERLPDPAIGVRLATDRSAHDHVTGLYVVVPLPGEARRALADGATAQAAVAASQEAAMVQRVTADVALMVGQANGAYGAWTKARSAAEGMQRHAESTRRSWELREASLNDVLVARRLALESSLSAALARIEAAEARYRLLVEAHLLWNDPEEEREEHVD